MKCRGYTLVELLVVVAVSVLLVSGAIGLYVSFYSELHRETSLADDESASNRFETALRHDLRCLAKGQGAVHLDVTGDNSRLQLLVLDTSIQGLPVIDVVTYSLEKGKDIVTRGVIGQDLQETQFHVSGNLIDLLCVDSIGRSQGVWLWDDIIPRGIILTAEAGEGNKQKTLRIFCCHISQ